MSPRAGAPRSARATATPPADHAALGAEGLALRRAKQLPEALEKYVQAAAAARRAGDAIAEATWTSKQGQIHRLAGSLTEAQRAFTRAREMFAALGDAGLSGVGDQEGNLGLVAVAQDDDFGGEYAYRRALDLTTAAQDFDATSLWACNLGNALTRRRRYRRARDAYARAIEAGRRAENAALVPEAAQRLSASYAAAAQWEKSAEALEVALTHTSNPGQKIEWATEMLRALMRAGAWARALEVSRDVLAMLDHFGAAPAREQVMVMVRDAERALKEDERPEARGGPPLDEVAIGAMAHYEQTRAGAAMAWVGHLIADIHCGLGAPRFDEWKRFLSDPSLYYRIVGDVMVALCEAGAAEESLVLSQRMKGAAFALPFLSAARGTTPELEAAREYSDALNRLRDAVEALAAARPHERHALANRVRAAGEALLEAGQYLADTDRDTLARVGGVVSPRHLLDALPVGDPICILDFVVTNKGLLVHVVLRNGPSAKVMHLLAPELSGEALKQIALVWGPDMVRAPDLERHREVLNYVGQVLHDNLFCQLAHWITEQRVGQVIIVPDLLTRHLPLHMARVCAKDIAIPGVDTQGAEYFCEVLPVEYAPCVQAIALSQHQRRPANVTRVVSFADAESNLPGARYTGTWLGTRISKDPEYVALSGAEVNCAAVEAEMRRAEMVLIGTHGVADAARPEASRLRFHDGDWTASDIAALAPLTQSPAVILAACEVAAATPGDDPAADGVPGALLSAGAAFVLGSRWPGEDVSMGMLIERFLHHSTNIGLRPAAILFRAVRDLRRVTRDEAVARCRELLDQMKRDGLDTRNPDLYATLDWRTEQIAAGANERPFEAPFYWGGVVVVGSGWSGLAGGVAGGARSIDGLLRIESARGVLESGDANGARESLADLVGQVDGVMRVQALELMALATARAAHPVCRGTALAEAHAWLDEARFLARAEQRPQLERNVEASREKLTLLFG